MARLLNAAVLGLAGLAAAKGGALYDALGPLMPQPAYAASEESGEAETGPAEGETAVNAAGPAASGGLSELLIGIEAERAELSSWRDELAQKEAEIALAKSALDAQAEQMEALKRELEHLLSRSARENTEDVSRLVGIYKAMKPVQAAAIMNDADIEVSVLVLSAMEPRNSGPIIALMEPVRARAISKIILERSRLPGDQKLVNLRLN
ncbi:MotE family protein [Leisingera sp. XS_AS12]|uniref:MotE family protein n=1 Tax=Leisingera sp. XS_AS12 TaxID=3241294 RepID=UPI00351683F1